MNLLELAIGAVSPGWALNRARSRAALRVVRSVELGYDAASMGRRVGNWKAGSTSANAEVTPALSRIRNRSRDLVRNNAYARSAIQKLVARTVGTGIVAQPPKAVDAVWKEFVEIADFEGQHDFYGLESLAFRTVVESGECLVRRIRGKNLRAPLKIQILEPDYLDDSKTGPVGNGNFAIAGIEVDQSGRRVAYWLFDHHPGELVQLPKTWTSKRVPASEILHVYEKERPGQLRGVPRLAATLMRLRDVDEYQDAQMMRKKIEACFAAFVTSPTGGTTLAEASNVATDDNGRRVETLAPGIVWYGKPGEEITFGQPSGVARDEYTVDQLHAIAAGAGVTYEQLTGDFSQVTYLSSRAAQVELLGLVEMSRWIHFIPMFCRGVWGWFVDAHYTAGRVRTDSYPGVLWTPPAWMWIDPAKDVTAAKEEIKGGLMSWSERIRQLGQDPDKVRAEIVADFKAFKEAGIELDTMTSKPVAAQAAAADDEDADAPKKDAKDKKDKADEEDEDLRRQVPAPVQLDARHTIAEGAIKVDVHLHQRSGTIEKTVVERDGRGLASRVLERELPDDKDKK